MMETDTPGQISLLWTQGCLCAHACVGAACTQTHARAHKHARKIPVGDSLLSSSQKPNPSEKIVSFAILFKT